MNKTEPRRAQRGNALVEASLTLSLFLTAIFSLYDFGWELFVHQTIVHQARTAARYGAVNPGDLTAIQNMAIWGQTTPGTAASAIMGLQPANIAVSRTAQGTSSDTITVTISGYTYVLITLGWAGTHTGYPITVDIPVEN